MVLMRLGLKSASGSCRSSCKVECAWDGARSSDLLARQAGGRAGEVFCGPMLVRLSSANRPSTHCGSGGPATSPHSFSSL